MIATPTRAPLEIAAVLDELYREAEAGRPTPEQSIVPLGRLIQGLNLTCHELPQLCSRAASDFLLRRGGIMTTLREASDEALAGFLYANAGGGSIFVRQEDPVSRRRFSVAHELGHYLLHFPLVLEAARRRGRGDEVELVEALPPAAEAAAEEASAGRVSVQDGDRDGAQAGDDSTISSLAASLLPPLAEMEREADAFAAALLMPEAVVCALVRRYEAHFSDVDLIWRLSTEMLVSRAAMRWRLRHLGLLRGDSAEWN